MLVILDKLNFYLYKFWGFIKPRRKLGLVSFVLLASFILVVWVVGTNIAHAGSFWDDIVQGLISVIMAVAGFFIKVTFFILEFVIEIAGYNGFIDSQAVIVGWVMVRDITNMFFVVVLLIISFGTILGLEQYEYKKLLVKLLLAAIIVNFSRIICGIIIDVAQVVMITFVNGIKATAAGNMVNMFGVQKIFSLSSPGGGQSLTQIVPSTGDQFVAAVAAITFAAIMMVTMLAFMFLLMARMMTLWILIVLSPFAFVLNVLPQTQKYAGQWWGEFGGNVVAGPIIAFFLWLSFVTVGAGNAHDQISSASVTPIQESTNPQETSVGLTSIMSWASMANFAIAIGMLLAGAKMAQQLGAAGGGLFSKAGEFGKKVAMTASGLTAARWAGRNVVKPAAKFAAMNVPLVGGKAWQRRGRQLKSFAGIVRGRFLEGQATAANKRMETLVSKEAGAGAKIKARLGLWFLAPEAIKEEFAGDLEEVNKMQRDIALTHTLSGSKMPLGALKTRTKARLHRMEWTGEAIKERKEAEEQEAYYRGPVDQIRTKLEPMVEKEEERRRKQVEEEEKKLGRPLTKDEQKEKKMLPLSDTEINNMVDQVAKTEGVAEINANFYKRELNSRRSKASAENINEVMDLKKKEALYRSRAAKYRTSGDNFRADEFETKANAVEYDHLREGLKGRRGLELVSIVEDTAAGVAAAREAVIKAQQEKNGEAEAKAAKELVKKQQQLFTAVTLARGHSEAWVSRAADAAVIKKAKIETEGLTDQEIGLSIDLGASIKDLKLDVAKAADEVTRVLGGAKKAQAALRERSIADEDNVVKGITERANMTSSEAGERGRTVYSVTSTVLAEPAAQRAQVQSYKKLINLSTIINAPVSIQSRDVSDMHIKRISKEELDIIADKLKQITTKVGIDKISDAFIHDLEQANVSADEVSKQAVKDFYARLEREMDKGAYEGFVARTQNFHSQGG